MCENKNKKISKVPKTL